MNNSSLSQALVGVTSLLVIAGTIIYFTLSKTEKKNDNNNDTKQKESERERDNKNRPRTPSNLEDKYPAGKMSIYFASQTGTAEGFARTIMAEAHKNGFDAKMVDLEDFDPEQVKSTRLGVFLVATYGEGDPTDNSAKFYKWLKNENGSVPTDFLAPLQFAVFGLGNSQYENFNKMGREFNEKLSALGATRVFDYGEGDDDATLEDDFENWKTAVIPALTKRFRPTTSNSLPVDENGPALKAHLTYEVEKCSPVKRPVIPQASLISTTSKYFFSSHKVTVTKNSEMRQPADGGHTVHMEFDISNSGVKYFTADNLAVIPDNTDASVYQFSQTCGGFELDQYISVVPVPAVPDEEPIPFKHPFPNPCSLRDVFTLYLDIDSIPRKSTLERLIPYITDKSQQNWLKNLVSKEHRDIFTHYIEHEGRTYTSLLSNELSSAEIPLADLFHLIPLIQPRYYTIASSSSCYPNSIHLTVSVVERIAPQSGAPIKGLCSGFLYDMSVNQQAKCRVFTRESLFRLPDNIRTPIIMIGPGSGIAPMRALLQEREYQATKAGVPVHEMTNILYFGCKGRNFDYIYQDELEQAVSRGLLTSLKVAFSREQEKKVYVQTLMQEKENAAELVRLIMDEEAHIFVCGGTGMGTTVGEVLTNLIAAYRGISHDEATAIIKAKQKNKMYKQELWSV